jgi:hypothetical protein
MWLKQSTNPTVISFGPFLDETNGVTLNSGIPGGGASALDHLTTGIMLSKNGGVLAVRNGTPTASTYDAHGCWRVTLNATDTGTLGTLRMIYTDAATCLPVWQDFMVVPSETYNSFVSPGPGTTPFPVDVKKWLANDVSHETGGIPNVNVTTINNDGTAADNADLFFSTEGYAGGTTKLDVRLADTVTHGGSAAVMTLERVVVASTTTNQPAVALAGNGSEAGLRTTGGATASGLRCIGGVTVGAGIHASSGAGNASPGIQARGSNGIDGICIATNGHGMSLVGVGTGDGLECTKGASGADIDADISGNLSGSVNSVTTSVATVGGQTLANLDVAISSRATAAAMTTAQADLDDIQSRLPAALIGGRMDSDVEAINASTEAADDLQFSAVTMVRGTVVADAGNSTMQMKTDLTPVANDHYKDRKIYFTSGVLADQATSISTYNGSTKILTFPALTSAPAADVTFVIV